MLKVAREFALEAGEVGVLRLVAALENWADGGNPWDPRLLLPSSEFTFVNARVSKNVRCHRLTYRIYDDFNS